MCRDFEVGDQVRITGSGSGSLHHALKVDSIGIVVKEGDTFETFRVEGVTEDERPLRQWVNWGDLEPARTVEEIRQEFLELIGVKA